MWLCGEVWRGLLPLQTSPSSQINKVVMAKDYSLEKQRRFTPVALVSEFISGLSVEYPYGLEWSAVGLSKIAVQLALPAIIAIGAFLRFWQLNSLGFNSDEAVYAGQGAAIAADPTLK